MGSLRHQRGASEANLEWTIQAAKSMMKGTTIASCNLRDTLHVSRVKATLSLLFIVFKSLLIQSRCYSDTASESKASDDGSLDDHNQDSEAVPNNDCESEELVMQHLLGPPEAASFASVQVADGLPYIAETELAGPALALLNSELIQSEVEESARVPEGEGSARVSDPDLLFIESEPTHTSQRWKCRDMSGLSQCLCGETAKLNEEGSIQCQKVGCETAWVSS